MKKAYLKEFNIDINQVAAEVKQIKEEKSRLCYDEYGNHVKNT